MNNQNEDRNYMDSDFFKDKDKRFSNGRNWRYKKRVK